MSTASRIIIIFACVLCVLSWGKLIFNGFTNYPPVREFAFLAPDGAEMDNDQLSCDGLVLVDGATVITLCEVHEAGILIGRYFARFDLNLGTAQLISSQPWSSQTYIGLQSAVRHPEDGVVLRVSRILVRLTSDNQTEEWGRIGGAGPLAFNDGALEIVDSSFRIHHRNERGYWSERPYPTQAELAEGFTLLAASLEQGQWEFLVLPNDSPDLDPNNDTGQLTAQYFTATETAAPTFLWDLTLPTDGIDQWTIEISVLTNAGGQMIRYAGASPTQVPHYERVDDEWRPIELPDWWENQFFDYVYILRDNYVEPIISVGDGFRVAGEWYHVERAPILSITMPSGVASPELTDDRCFGGRVLAIPKANGGWWLTGCGGLEYMHVDSDFNRIDAPSVGERFGRLLTGDINEDHTFFARASVLWLLFLFPLGIASFVLVGFIRRGKSAPRGSFVVFSVVYALPAAALFYSYWTISGFF